LLYLFNIRGVYAEEGMPNYLTPYHDFSNVFFFFVSTLNTPLSFSPDHPLDEIFISRILHHLGRGDGKHLKYLNNMAYGTCSDSFTIGLLYVS